MTRISAALWMLLSLATICGRPLPGRADACDEMAPGDPACIDHGLSAPPRRWPIPSAVPRPVVDAWSGVIPGWLTAGPQGRELARFPAPGWQGQQVVHLNLYGVPTLPPAGVSCSVELRKLDGTAICAVETTAETVGNIVTCNVTERILVPVSIRVVLTTASGGSCHMGGGWWAAPNP